MPVRVPDVEECMVKLRRADVTAFFRNRAGVLADVVAGLRSSAGGGGHVGRVYLLGDFGDYPDFVSEVEKLLGAVESAPLSYLADGAALAAQERFTAAEPTAAPPVGSLAQYLAEHERRCAWRPGGRAGPQNWSSSARARSTDCSARTSAMRPRLSRTRSRTGPTGCWRLSERGNRARLRTDPPSAGASAGVNAATPGPRRSRRRTGCSPPAGYSTPWPARARPTRAPEDHHVLMSMLDVHHRAAALLAGPANFEAAVTQFALRAPAPPERPGTREALAAHLLERGLYLEAARARSARRGACSKTPPSSPRATPWGGSRTPRPPGGPDA